MSARIAIPIAAAIAVAWAAAPTVALAQLNPDGGEVVIDSDTADHFNEQGLTVFEGRVDVSQDDTQLRTDRLELYSDPGAEGGSGELGDIGNLVRAVAVGNVYYVTPERVATGDRAVYDVATDTVTMTGREVIVTQGCDILTGTEVVMNLTTNDVQVRATQEDRQGRVRTVIRTGDQQAAAAECEQ